MTNNNLPIDQNLKSNKIIILEPVEASKFSYIIGWLIYMLTKNDYITKGHSKFEIICAYLKVLSLEQIIYKHDVHSQTTNVISGKDFLDFMYKMESLILLLFEKHEEFGPNILQYIHNNLLNNIPMFEFFNTLINISSRMLNSGIDKKQELDNEIRKFLYDRIISIYIKSRQKSWRRFHNLTLRKPKLGLIQLQIWAKLEGAEEEFSKMFLVSEFQWLIWAFEDNAKNKRKKNLIPLILDYIRNYIENAIDQCILDALERLYLIPDAFKKETPFSEEAFAKEQIFIW
ncbi:hypothetical protein Glove_165g67 [Diversispora epigaea]|uniref:Uncharacterized protein n=1 Tax=Diversispora epigaea TaxID=1348612 RepID=A0A397IQY2_9GLOM|nr:hypothetical protein Glove_165g67 [Diversispora epigaea]